MSVTLITTLGRIKIELDCLACPKTCESFLALCASGQYTNTIFHRNIRDFMIQGGDPTGTGKGGRAVSESGAVDDEFNESLRHDRRGVVSMANSGPNTNRSQFFITYDAQEQLDNVYPVFGRVIDGLPTLDRMEGIEVDATDRPRQEIRILRIHIHANPFAEGLFPSNFSVEDDSD